ncbi:MTERF5 [Symbiodinium sp. KB8]|nr:MTERF5 [Symbiodinium sp. KB8]
MKPSPHHRKPWRQLACLFLGFLTLSWNSCAVRSPPAWWRAGRPRKRLGSAAEAELLSHLAVLLLPEEPIGELFRDFPVKQPGNWGKSHLSPDLSVYGALKKKDAAVFLEYDGYYRHHTPQGIAADIRKSEALLRQAPNGSQVLRISHAQRGWDLACHTSEVIVDPWQSARPKSLAKALRQIVQFVRTNWGSTLQTSVNVRLQDFLDSPADSFCMPAVEFTRKVAATGDCDPSQLHDFLREQLNMTASQSENLTGKHPALKCRSVESECRPIVQWLRDAGLKKAQIAKVIGRFLGVLGYSIEGNLNPIVQWLRDLGLKKAEIAKVISRFPQVLGCSIAENLKPTVQWLRDAGLKKAQIAKVIGRFPGVLGYSIEGNLNPTVQWLRDLGLKKAEIAKVISRFPQALGCSIEENLKPTVQWLRDLGLEKDEIAKVIGRFPFVLGCSIEGNLNPTVQWLRDLGLKKAEIAKVIGRVPQVLGYSIEGNLKPTVQWLRDAGLKKAQVAKVIGRHPQVLGYSIEGNLKPTVKWLHDLGLNQTEVARTVVNNPSMFGFCIESNLALKIVLLQQFVTPEHLPGFIAQYPVILNFSYERWAYRIKVLRHCRQPWSFGPALELTDAAFFRRYGTHVDEPVGVGSLPQVKKVRFLGGT